jgi:hypothetical protein
MPSKTQYREKELYADLMEEVKIRIECIESALRGETQFPGRVVSEFCYLQLRLLCETIALGCLLAHGDISAARSKDLSKAYEADRIIEKLAKLHSEFYPKPRKQVRTGPTRLDYALPDYDFLAQNELVQLWRKCGKILHRGRLKDILPKRPLILVQTTYSSGGGKLTAY